jgi:XTP/dITP diphosphohydrolase
MNRPDPRRGPPEDPVEGGPRPRITLHDHAPRLPTPRDTLDRLQSVAALALPLILSTPGGGRSVLADLDEVEVSLIDDDTIAGVHADFLDDPTPTDVITFHHGEILVSVETAAREAAARDGDTARETALYIIHGLLHLHGHEDADPDARTLMHDAQERILQTVWPPEKPIPVLLATHNAHKTEEVRAILGPGFEVTDLKAWPGAAEPEETGATFSENAAIKALAASALVDAGTWVLADDSGLEVDALGGAPGVQSARYSGRHGDNTGHRAKLLAELERLGICGDNRRARFRCVLALARDGRLVAEFQGAVEGSIAPAERGTGGFGYDPLFVPEGETATFGELPETTKNRLSHRARALAALAASGLLRRSP